MTLPDMTTPSKCNSHPQAGIETTSPGTRSSEEIRSKTASPSPFGAALRTSTVSEDWMVDRSFPSFCQLVVKFLNQWHVLTGHLFQLVDGGGDANDGHDDDGHGVRHVLIGKPEGHRCDLDIDGSNIFLEA